MSIQGYGRSAQEEKEYLEALWPGTETLKNKWGLLDEEELLIAERHAVSQRVEGGFPSDAHPRSYDGLKAMHRHMFQDIYDWAGEERRYTTGRGPAPFARPEFIKSSMDDLFRTLERKNHLTGLDLTNFSREAAEAVNVINAAHPFIDGNGRVQRQWLRLSAKDAGFEVELKDVDVDRWNEASKQGFLGDDTEMEKLSLERAKPLTRFRSHERDYHDLER